MRGTMLTKTQTICELLLLTMCLSACDPVYGGVHNYYPEAIKVELDTNDPKVVRTLDLPPGQGFTYRRPTQMRGITIKTADGRTITYNSAAIEKIASDIHEPNQDISWALTPEGLFADCVQHAVMVDCRKPGEPPSQWKEKP